MKFAQLLMVIFIVNILNVIIGFSIQMEDINEFEDTISEWFTDSSSGYFQLFSSFTNNLRTHDNWLVKKIADIAQGFTSAINLVTIGFHIIGLVLWGWITPIGYVMFTSEEITLLKLIGFIALFYIQWFNIMAIVKLYKFIKGSDA